MICENKDKNLKSNQKYCPSSHALKNKIARTLWILIWNLLFRSSPKIFHGWRRMLLGMFGAKIGQGSVVHPSCKIWAPWNLEMGENSCLGPDVDCYCVDHIHIGNYVTVSQYSHLCTASHDFEKLDMPLITSPIIIEDRVWLCADVFIGPNVVIGEGAVIGSKSSVFKDVESWSIVGGNPVKFIKKRSLEKQVKCNV